MRQREWQGQQLRVLNKALKALENSIKCKSQRRKKYWNRVGRKWLDESAFSPMQVIFKRRKELESIAQQEIKRRVIRGIERDLFKTNYRGY